MGSCCVTQQPADSSDDHAAPHVGKMIMTHQAMIKHEDEEVNSIIPVKPMVYLTAPIKLKKGEFVLLG